MGNGRLKVEGVRLERPWFGNVWIYYGDENGASDGP